MKPAPGERQSADLDEAVSALRELILAGEGYRVVASSRLGLTTTESQALSYLLARGPMGQTDLASVLGLTTSSITALVDRLENRGFVDRVPNPADRRRVTVRLSATRAPEVRDARKWMEEAVAQAVGSAPDAATAILGAMAASLRMTTEHMAASTEPALPRRRP